MQNDLISRIALIEQIKGFTNVCEGYFENPNLLMDVIEKQPTAYDVEKVVAELGKQIERTFYNSLSGSRIAGAENGAYHEALKIVRNGGKE